MNFRLIFCTNNVKDNSASRDLSTTIFLDGDTGSGTITFSSSSELSS
jgi:hypothetical protein